MAGSLNRVALIGNLGRDPEIRTFGNGSRVCGFSLACSETWRDKNTGERKEKTEWINVSVFGEGLIRLCEQYLRKGSKVYVEGKFSTRKWQDKSGRDRYSTEVVIQGFGGQIIMLGGYGQGDSQYGQGDSQGGGQSQDQSTDYGGGPAGPGQNDPFDDDIPF